MILFNFSLLFSFFFVKDQIASFQLKQIFVFFEEFRVCILISFFYLRDCDRVWVLN